MATAEIDAARQRAERTSGRAIANGAVNHSQRRRRWDGVVRGRHNVVDRRVGPAAAFRGGSVGKARGCGSGRVNKKKLKMRIKTNMQWGSLFLFSPWHVGLRLHTSDCRFWCVLQPSDLRVTKENKPFPLSVYRSLSA